VLVVVLPMNRARRRRKWRRRSSSEFARGRAGDSEVKRPLNWFT